MELPKKISYSYAMYGNDALALGAIAGGLKFYSSYPMTPTSNLLHILAGFAKKGHLVVKHAEDEISAINMAIGASFAGIRSMVGTSGGGFCLMNEGLGLSGIAEVPLVVINGQRPGPAIGMPTWTSQGDLSFILNAVNDEFLRIVLAPGYHMEIIAQTKNALELAEKFQIPVIILVDKHLTESSAACQNISSHYCNQRYGFELKPVNFLRYRSVKNGISCRTIPGQPNGMYICNSYEHDEYGFSSEKSADRCLQVNKRFNKIDAIIKMIPEQAILGNRSSKTGLIGWGSTFGPVHEALKQLPFAKALSLSWLWPFPRTQVKQFIESCQEIYVIEGNKQGQLGNLIAQELQIKIRNKLLKYDGRPFWPEEIVSYIKERNA